MNINANGEKDTADDEKGIEDRVLGEEQSSPKDNALNIDGVNEEHKDRPSSVVQGQGILQVQQPAQPPPQGTVVCWERFLHVRSIRVLLVENDDSTRHVVSALLRNCNYEVLEAANGMQAWKILEDLTNHIDLILTEVVMPCLSGVGLLCKIMSHRTRKNVPVIMMSSHDSRGLVFKCLSSGAVDFLVKPIRKNELKNLWQHVWRRCHSSSGSGSESGAPTQKSVKSKRSDKSDDNSGSNDGENNGSTGLNIDDGSDDGSGAQSSWTKQAVEVDSPQALSPVDQVADCLDSTCAQFIRSNAEISGSKWLLNSVALEGHEDKHHDPVAKAKDQETLSPRNFESQSENPVEDPSKVIRAKQETTREIDCKMRNKLIEKGPANPTDECLFSKYKIVSPNTSNPHPDGEESKSTRQGANTIYTNIDVADNSKDQNLERSSKRLRGYQNKGRTMQDDHLVLHYEQSAFSRYGTSSNVFKAPNGVMASRSVVDNSEEVAKRDSAYKLQAQSTVHPPYQILNGVCNNIDMGSSTNKFSNQSSVVKDQSEEAAEMGLYHQFPMQHIHHHYEHHHHHHFHIMEQPSSSNHAEPSLEKLGADASQSRSPNLSGRTMGRGDTGTYNLNTSVLESNHGCTEQIGSSNIFTAVGNIDKRDVGQAGESGNGDASGSGNRNEENKLAQREAALTKYLRPSIFRREK